MLVLLGCHKIETLVAAYHPGPAPAGRAARAGTGRHQADPGRARRRQGPGRKALAAASTRSSTSLTRAILSAEDSLTLVVNTCGGDPAIDLLREQNETVEVAVVSTRTFGGPGGEDCQDTIEAQLKAPPGDRNLVDATTGDDLVVDAG